MSYTPERMLPDDRNFFEANGKTIRKGTIAAVLANAAVIESDTATQAEKMEALEMLKTLAPTLTAFGLTTFLQWKNPRIQAIFDPVY